jgi:hypothetical protein
LATGADRSTIVVRQAEDVHSAAFDPVIETIDLAHQEACAAFG